MAPIFISSAPAISGRRRGKTPEPTNRSMGDHVMSKFEELKNHVLDLEKDFEAFYDKGNKAAGTRVRKAMLALKKLAQDIRTDVQDKKS
jgi:hypothetical protein